ncbi:MAG: DNA-processing protein DprA [Bacteroidales bacterium]
MEFNDLIYACALNRIFNYNCKGAKKLIDTFGSPTNIYRQSRQTLKKECNLSDTYLNKLEDKSYFDLALKDIEWAEKSKVSIYYIGDHNYPKNLIECCDAPIILYYKGTANLNAKRIISIVGTRSATPYGRQKCQEIVKHLSELNPKPIIVSGLAYGIDIEAHKAALQYGMKTIGVMATGMNQIYPTTHRKYAIQFLKQGGILTDFPINTAPIKVNFLRRNRIIAGISNATIVIESKEKGGSMNTATIASSYNRDVFALPGRISDIKSQGCNYLIAENKAQIIYNPETISQELNWQEPEKIYSEMKSIFDIENGIKAKILLALSDYKEKDIDQIVKETKLNISDLILNLTELELDGKIHLNRNKKYTII